MREGEGVTKEVRFKHGKFGFLKKGKRVEEKRGDPRASRHLEQDKLLRGEHRLTHQTGDLNAWERMRRGRTGIPRPAAIPLKRDLV